MKVSIPLAEYRLLMESDRKVARITGYLREPVDERDNPVKMLAHVRDIVSPCEHCGGKGEYEGQVANRFGGGLDDVMLACDCEAGQAKGAA